MENSVGLTIVIATYNACGLIEKTLDCLLKMEKVSGLPWEILVVDNNSTDGTPEFVRSLWKDPSRLRILNEPNQGTGFAKFRGMIEAKYTYIGFVDQDNWVDSDWMLTAIKAIESASKAAVICGRGMPVFGAEKPKWFDRYQQNYAVGRQAEKDGCVSDPNRFLYAAGSILRKSAFDDLIDLGFRPILQSRAGKQLLSGEDTELQILLRLRGWEIHYQDDISFRHYMPPQRLTRDYFIRFRKGLGASSVYLQIYRDFVKRTSGPQKDDQLNWFKLLLRSLWQCLRDPMAIAVSLFPRFTGNFRVAKYWLRLGELLERLRLGSKLHATQQKTSTWLAQLSTGKIEVEN
ncbi:MAG TPA: glycosyltransferase [Anaerolineaceae bacterium]|nr:glycosyltransferase [Anaerolineaceae bacterium]